MEEKVILVDLNDQAIGEMEKIQAHEQALLHRAFSIFVFNTKGQLMLQQRQLTKYHSGGLWTNTCCGHPRPHETTKEAAQRRLREEMGFFCELNHKFYFTYKASLDNNLTEYELDHVFFGQFDTSPILNPEEAADWNWVGWDDLCDDIINNPDNYTFWLKVCVEKINDLQLIK